MPNQGLKPAEADSIATYLLAEFQEKSPVQAEAPPDTSAKVSE
jgi:hypothetical protein